MVHHLREIRKANPCTEMTGFTRLLSSPKGNLDALASEIPTVTARALDGGNGCRHGGGDTCDMGFPVMNRPHAVTQLLADLPSTITEEYVLIAETDHIFLRDIPNRATPESPACFPFGYMDAKAAELRPVVSRFARDPDSVDPCGPSPVLIHLPLLRKLTPEWLSMSFKLKRDAEAERIFGWVTEMWGYTIAANNLGIKHLVWQNIQLEPSSLWHANLDGDPYIYHYTFGLEFTSDGLPVSTIGEWSLDKRHYMNAYPPRQLEPPPSGPWSWQGVTPVAFLGGGVLHTPWGPGTWEPHPTKGGSTIYANFVGEKHAVIFDECWSFVSVRDRDGDRASGVAKIEPPAKSCPHL